MPTERLTTPAGLTIPAAALTLRFSRSGGPGGQHVNTSSTRVELVCDLSEAKLDRAVFDRIRSRLGTTVRVAVDSQRSQTANRTEAYQRMASRLDAAARVTKRRRATRPTPASKRRRAEQKQRRSRLKQQRRWRQDDG